MQCICAYFESTLALKYGSVSRLNAEAFFSTGVSRQEVLLLESVLQGGICLDLVIFYRQNGNYFPGLFTLFDPLFYVL